MQNKILAAAIASALAWPAQSSAGNEAQLERLEQRIQYLEQRVQSQDEVIRDKDRHLEALMGGEPGGDWFRNVEIGGLIEVEVGYSDPYEGDSTSDVTVATVELGIAAQVTDWVAGEITLLYEQDETDLEVDVATITIAPPEGPWFVNAGQFYVPFGVFETNLVSDPLTLEIGETRETSVQFGFEGAGASGSVYVFNGDNQKDGDDRIDNWGAVIGYAMESDDFNFAGSICYINDIGDSDALHDALGSNDVADYVGGWTLSAFIETGPFVIIGEYVSATDAFDPSLIEFNGAGAEPSAWNIEAGYNFLIAGRAAVAAVGYQGTAEALALELPEERVLAAISVEIMERTALSFEWAHDTDYGVGDGGTGESADTLTLQLAYEF